MDASCKIQRSIHDVRLTYKYVSRILGTYQKYRKLRFLCAKKVHRSGIESDFRLIVHIRYIINCDEGERILMVDEIH